MPSGTRSGAIGCSSAPAVRRPRSTQGVTRRVNPRRMLDSAMPKTVSRWPENSQYPRRSRRPGRAPRAGRDDEGSDAEDTAGSGSLAPDRGGEKGLIDQHDRDVGDDGIDETGGGAIEPLLDDRLLVAEVLPVSLHQQGADLFREVDELQLSLGLGADENLEQLGIDSHRA